MKTAEPLLTPPPEPLRVFEALRDAGHESYFCGGCVRDALMGVKPKDWDIATAATPDQVEELFPKTIPVGKAFGVIVVKEETVNIEVATFRTEGGYQDGRRPEKVAFSSSTEDVLRRDFTLNALLYDPRAGEVIDHVGGCADIKAGLIRAVGDPRERFAEDHLRLLRAVRFAGRTGFVIEEETFAAMQGAAHLVRRVSGERVGEEVKRMLTEGYARTAVECMHATGLLQEILPELVAMQGVTQPEQFHPEGDVWVHTMIMLKDMDGAPYSPVAGKAEPAVSGEGIAADHLAHLETALASPRAREMLGFAVLLHDVGKPPTRTVTDRIRFNGHDKTGSEMAEAILIRLKRPRAVIDSVMDLIKRHMHFAALPKMRKAKLRRFLQEPHFPLHLELHRLDCASSHRMMDTYAFAVQALVEEAREPAPVDALLTGKDLIAMGFPPGPRMGEMLQAVRDAQLEGEITSAEEARQFVDKHFSPGA